VTGLARSTDPATSHWAADEFLASGGGASQLGRLEYVFRIAHEPLTAREATRRAGLLPSQADRGTVPWHRVTDLYQLGVLNKTGQTIREPDTDRRQQTLVWVPPEERVTGDELAARRSVKINGADVEIMRRDVETTRERLAKLVGVAGVPEPVRRYIQSEIDRLTAALDRMPVIS
jgi:hypothetical protein